MFFRLFLAWERRPMQDCEPPMLIQAWALRRVNNDSKLLLERAEEDLLPQSIHCIDLKSNDKGIK
jgi:hypothetical protein